jgi:hypothetical protein
MSEANAVLHSLDDWLRLSPSERGKDQDYGRIAAKNFNGQDKQAGAAEMCGYACLL